MPSVEKRAPATWFGFTPVTTFCTWRKSTVFGERSARCNEYDLILTLTAAWRRRSVLGYVTQRIGLSPIVGYLLAGVLVGPTRRASSPTQLAKQLAEVGVILLMFGVGLQFHVEELLAVRRVAIPGAVGQSLVATALGAASRRLGFAAGIVFGMALVGRQHRRPRSACCGRRQLHTPTGHIAVGWLVVEDLFTVLVLVLLPALPSARRRDAVAASARDRAR